MVTYHRDSWVELVGESIVGELATKAGVTFTTSIRELLDAFAPLVERECRTRALSRARLTRARDELRQTNAAVQSEVERVRRTCMGGRLNDSKLFRVKRNDETLLPVVTLCLRGLPDLVIAAPRDYASRRQKRLTFGFATKWLEDTYANHLASGSRSRNRSRARARGRAGAVQRETFQGSSGLGKSTPNGTTSSPSGALTAPNVSSEHQQEQHSYANTHSSRMQLPSGIAAALVSMREEGIKRAWSFSVEDIVNLWIIAAKRVPSEERKLVGKLRLKEMRDPSGAISKHSRRRDPARRWQPKPRVEPSAVAVVSSSSALPGADNEHESVTPEDSAPVQKKPIAAAIVSTEMETTGELGEMSEEEKSKENDAGQNTAKETSKMDKAVEEGEVEHDENVAPRNVPKSTTENDGQGLNSEQMSDVPDDVCKADATKKANSAEAVLGNGNSGGHGTAAPAGADLMHDSESDLDI